MRIVPCKPDAAPVESNHEQKPTCRAFVASHTFGELIAGQKFHKSGRNYIKVGPREAFPLNAEGIAVPANRTKFFEHEGVCQVS